ncbi:MAG: ATP synthase F0 subunit C, partial [Bdellovibrionales bacterium]|nr:ATP synthase F0 subunit C [Bdellovibrionales bacterium]
IGLAVFGAASGQGKAANAALEGIARNPSASGSMFVPLILSLALMESLVILTFLTSLNITNAITSLIGG